jgi:hypothetical protein
MFYIPLQHESTHTDLGRTSLMNYPNVNPEHVTPYPHLTRHRYQCIPLPPTQTSDGALPPL